MADGDDDETAKSTASAAPGEERDRGGGQHRRRHPADERGPHLAQVEPAAVAQRHQQGQDAWRRRWPDPGTNRPSTRANTGAAIRLCPKPTRALDEGADRRHGRATMPISQPVTPARRPRWRRRWPGTSRCRTGPRSGPRGPPAPRGGRARRAAVVDDGDAVGPHGGGQAVGDDDRRPPLEHGVERPLDPRLGLQVEVRGRLVEHEHPGLGQERPGEGEQLALARADSDEPRSWMTWSSPSGWRSTRSPSPTASTAAHSSSSVASGAAKARLSRMEPANRNGSWGTTPIWRRSERSVTSRRSWPSMRTVPWTGS